MKFEGGVKYPFFRDLSAHISKGIIGMYFFSSKYVQEINKVYINLYFG
jgi:hypothetical protein